jgi:hypothetical protein
MRTSDSPTWSPTRVTSEIITNLESLGFYARAKVLFVYVPKKPGKIS